MSSFELTSKNFNHAMRCAFIRKAFDATKIEGDKRFLYNDFDPKPLIKAQSYMEPNRERRGYKAIQSKFEDYIAYNFDKTSSLAQPYSNYKEREKMNLWQKSFIK